MGFYIDSDTGEYYEGDQRPGDQSVPQRPSPHHGWDGNAWSLDIDAAKNDALGAVKQAGKEKLADLDNALEKFDIRAAIAPFKVQFQAASTEGEVWQVKADALASIEAL